MLTPLVTLFIILGYFVMLIVIAYLTSRGNTDNHSFFMAKRQSPWYLIAIGMIGTSISGVTFISVPGWVEESSMSYMQTVFGFLLGYTVIAFVLMPMYYRLQLVSIYTYLERRLGTMSYKTGSAFFLLSRGIGSGFRLYLAAMVMHQFVTGPLGVSFPLTVAITIGLIWAYTFRGGVKTIIWTDLVQTLFLISALVMSLFFLGSHMGLDLGSVIDTVRNSPKSQIFFFSDGWSDPKNFFKQVLAGMSICIVMSGLDQDIMQKNLTVKTLRGAQTNMITYGVLIAFMNLLFLSLGILLFQYAAQNGIAIPLVNGKPNTDLLFPTVALQHATPMLGVLFLLGILASTYASADSALTSLTTAFCIDFLGFGGKESNQKNTERTRTMVHLGFSVLLFFIILVFYRINDTAVIKSIYNAASLTYGPLLGLFAFGFLTRLGVRDRLVPVVCILAPIISYVVNLNSAAWFGGYKFGFELLIFNGLLTFLGLLAISRRGNFSV